MDPDSRPKQTPEQDGEGASIKPADSRVTWRVHPAARRPMAAVLSLCVIGVISGLAWLGFGGPAWGLLAAVVLIGSLHRFFFASLFEMDDERIVAQTMFTRRELRWKDVRALWLDANGGFLSRTGRRRWFDRIQGMFVLFDENRRLRIEQIRDRLRRADPQRWSDSPTSD